MGKEIYVGKAKKLNLWKEMNHAFNRKMNNLFIYSVSYPSRKSNHNTQNNQNRKIQKNNELKLYDCAYHFSAYQVEEHLIDNLEAFVTRAFANSLRNIRIENFSKLK